MLSLHSSTLAALTLSGGVFAALALPNSVHAGDKIEFSTPSGSLDVPRMEVEKEEEPKPEGHPASPLNRMVSGEIAASTEVIIVTPSRRHDDRKWDSIDGNARDGMEDADNSFGYGDRSDSPDSRRSTTIRPDQNPEDSFARFSDKRNNLESTEPDSLRGRLEAADAAEKADADGTGRYERSGLGASSDSPWVHDYSARDLPREKTAAQKLSELSHSLFNHSDVSGINRMEDKTLSSYGAMKDINERVYSAPRVGGDVDEIRRNPASSLGPDNFATENNDLQKRADDEAMGRILSLHAQESLSTTLTPERAARDEVPASRRWEVEQRPAILPFPKKPGDVLR